jgi:hypothetical protein
MREIPGAKVDVVLGAAREFVRAGQREGVVDRELDPTHVVLTRVGSTVKSQRRTPRMRRTCSRTATVRALTNAA